MIVNYKMAVIVCTSNEMVGTENVPETPTGFISDRIRSARLVVF
jgi:hypothetical protein